VLVHQFLLAVDGINVYDPVIVSAAVPYAVISLGEHCL